MYQLLSFSQAANTELKATRSYWPNQDRSSRLDDHTTVTNPTLDEVKPAYLITIMHGHRDTRINKFRHVEVQKKLTE